jgi:hypothetical protein
MCENERERKAGHDDGRGNEPTKVNWPSALIDRSEVVTAAVCE